VSCRKDPARRIGLSQRTTTEITEKILVYTEITVAFFELEDRPEECPCEQWPLIRA
jgi:hypothetical protein